MARAFDDASSQYLSRSAAPISAVPLTMACWFKTDDLTVDQCLCAIGTAGTNNHKHQLYFRGTTAGDPIAALSRQTSAQEAKTTTSVTANAWHHAGGVWVSNTDRRAFLDGGGKGTNAAARTPVGMDTTRVGQGFASGFFMSGRIAEVCVWNVALSDAQIGILANGVNPRTVRPDAIVAYWPLHGVGSPEPDYSGNGYHLTLNASPTQADHAPVSRHPRRLLLPPHAVAAGGGASLIAQARPTNRFVFSRVFGRVA